MSRNITPRPIKASGAKDSHGRILERGAGALYVHMHREAGLAHRHYVLKPWQVRTLAIFTARPMVLLYVIAIASWGWLAGQASRVPLLKMEMAALQSDAHRLDSLSATLARLQDRYDQVQRMMSAANAAQRGTAAKKATIATQDSEVAPPSALVDSAKSAAPRDSSSTASGR